MIDELQIETNTQEIEDKAAFNLRAIDSISDAWVAKLNKAAQTVESLLSDFQLRSKQQEEILNQINAESRLLCIIPEKIQNRLSEITPDIAKEVDRIYTRKLAAVEAKYDSLQKETDHRLEEHKIAMTNTVNTLITKLTETTNLCSHSVETTLSSAITSLTQETTTIIKDNRNRFFKNLAIMIIFSSIISAITAYIIVNSFPRYVEIQGANNISVTESKVNIVGATAKDEKEIKAKVSH